MTIAVITPICRGRCLKFLLWGVPCGGT